MSLLTKLGKLPSGERLKTIQDSPNYKDGSFKNLNHTPDLTEGATYYGVIKENYFTFKHNVKPTDRIPSQKTDLLQLKPTEDILVWFGHSSYFMQVDGKKILVDPVLSGSAAPVSFAVQAFAGADVYTVDELPDLDYLFISHDHYDHLDYETIMELKPRIGKVICGLGIGAHFEHWGFAKDNILEGDWHDEIKLSNGFVVHLAPARHFSGRSITRNQALWTAFVLQTPSHRIFIGGDSGYDTHFAAIGKKYGPFDLAILENGQYDKSWKYIHMTPEEVLLAAKDLGARKLLPVHSGKFTLANHPWDEPLSRITSLPKAAGLQVLTPMIGERLELKNDNQVFKKWWEGVK